MAIEIRDANPSDLLALCALREPLIAHEKKFEQARAGTLRFLVAEEQDSIIAFASLVLANPTVGPKKSYIPKLSDLEVKVSERRRGVGRLLVEARENIAREAGHRSLYVSVNPRENAPWLEFFMHRGFRPLQEAPYMKIERWTGPDGRVLPVPAWRQDLVLQLE